MTLSFYYIFISQIILKALGNLNLGYSANVY